MTLAPSALARGAPSVPLLGVFVAAVGIRLMLTAVTVGFHTPAEAEPASDSRIHVALVRSLLAGRGFSQDGEPVATTPPLYVLWLAGLYGLGATPGAVRVLQAFLGGASCLLLWALGRRLFGDAAALLASALLAVHPAVSYLAGFHLTENLFLPLMLLFTLQADRVVRHPSARGAFTLGGVLGLTALARAAFLLSVPLVTLWASLRWGVRSGTTYRVLGWAGLGCALALLPWTVRNAVVLRTLAPVQSNGALVFWAANNPHADGGLVWPTARTWTGSAPPDDGRYGWRHLSVSEENRLYLREAFRWIRERPGDYLRLVGLKLSRLYGFTRSTDDQSFHVPLGVAVFQVSLYGLAAVGGVLAWRQRRPVDLLVLLVAFTHLTAVLFAGSSRYALPMVPALVLWAGFAASEGLRWVKEGT